MGSKTVKLVPPYSKVPVSFPEGMVDRFLGAGWKHVEAPKPKRADSKKSEKE